MILEGFEIENWSCIKHVSVTELPSAGVIVLHGPNGTGKSSIIEALRACLMDSKSTSKALGRGLPKNSSEKPRVSVTFRAAGTTWKITKRFNSKESKLESRTATGQWKLETDDPSAAHEQTRLMMGGSDSNLGLQQLLWLTQAEFHLPDPKKFDANVQSRLRSVLGVLQTPLDDRFLARVKEARSRWFGARAKPGEKSKLKKECALDKALTDLEKQKDELANIEGEFQGFERLMEKSGDLEVKTRDLRRQLEQALRSRDLLQTEYEQSLKRIEAHRGTVERVAAAQKSRIAAQDVRQKRMDVEGRLRDAETSADVAREDAEGRSRLLVTADQELRETRRGIQLLRDTGRDLQARRDAVSKQQKYVALQEQVVAAGQTLQRAEQESIELEKLKEKERTHPAPEPTALKELEVNRTLAGKLRAKLEAAAIALTLAPEAGAAMPGLKIDEEPLAALERPADGAPVQRWIRRRADIAIPGWGRMSLTRGTDDQSLDQIESQLAEAECAFEEALAPFGVAGDSPNPLDLLRALAGEKKARDPEITRRKTELNRLAPRGLDQSRQDFAQLSMRLQASSTDPELPLVLEELERIAEAVQEQFDATEEKIRAAESDVEKLEREIDGDAGFVGGKKTSKVQIAGGLRQQEAAAMATLHTLNATAGVLRGELDRMLTTEQVDKEIHDTEVALNAASDELAKATLTENEETIGERLESAKQAANGIQTQLDEVERQFSQIKGVLSHTEGLHQRRSAAAVRVEELARQTDRDLLESETFDKLYTLFEECRDKQLGMVMGPIHDRVVRWMRLLRIGAYQAIRFNDQFLPESLLSRDGTSELAIEEESIGTIEQLALMVRLALGSTLSTADEPAVAMLDDPLTHSDVVRLDRMRAVMRSAAAGDGSSTPPSGPLQVFVFTCHPEWFAIEGAKVIDLGNNETLSRLST